MYNKNMEGIKFEQKDNDAEKIKELEKLIYEVITPMMNPVVAGEAFDDYSSGDAASYYTLVKLKDGQSKMEKLGWGKMSKDTFTKAIEDLRYPDSSGKIREIPVPIYCVRQEDSYFLNEEELKKAEEDVIAYLKSKAVFVYDKGGDGFVGNEKKGNAYDHTLPLDKLPYKDIDEAIKLIEAFKTQE